MSRKPRYHILENDPATVRDTHHKYNYHLSSIDDATTLVTGLNSHWNTVMELSEQLDSLAAVPTTPKIVLEEAG